MTSLVARVDTVAFCLHAIWKYFVLIRIVRSLSRLKTNTQHDFFTQLSTEHLNETESS